MFNLKLPFQWMFKGIADEAEDTKITTGNNQSKATTTTKTPVVKTNTAVLPKYTPYKPLDFSKGLSDITLPGSASAWVWSVTGFELPKVKINTGNIQKDIEWFKISPENALKAVSSVVKPVAKSFVQQTGIENFSDRYKRTWWKAGAREEYVRWWSIEPLAVDYADAFWKTTQDFVSQTYKWLLWKAKNYVERPENILDQPLAEMAFPALGAVDLWKAVVGKQNVEKIKEFINNSPIKVLWEKNVEQFSKILEESPVNLKW